jgi:hypothetical protein
MEENGDITRHIEAMREWCAQWVIGCSHYCHTDGIASGLELVLSLPTDVYWGPIRETWRTRYHVHMIHLGQPSPGGVELEPPYWMEFERIALHLIEMEKARIEAGGTPFPPVPRRRIRSRSFGLFYSRRWPAVEIIGGQLGCIGDQQEEWRFVIVHFPRCIDSPLRDLLRFYLLLKLLYHFPKLSTFFFCLTFKLFYFALCWELSFKSILCLLFLGKFLAHYSFSLFELFLFLDR